MLKRWVTTALSIAVISSGGLQAAEGEVSDSAIGLSKTSVLDTPAPEAYSYPEKEPEEGGVLPRAFSGAPPQVSHKVDDYLPLTPDSNQCLECHDTKVWKKKHKKGDPTPIPKSHYNKVGSTWEPNNGRYTCTQCHVPQANAKDLVVNVFKKK